MLINAFAGEVKKALDPVCDQAQQRWPSTRLKTTGNSPNEMMLQRSEERALVSSARWTPDFLEVFGKRVANIQDKNAVLASNAEHLKIKANFIACLLIQTRDGYQELLSRSRIEVFRALGQGCENGSASIYNSLLAIYLDDVSNARRDVEYITARLSQSINDAESAMASAEAHTCKYFRWLEPVDAKG